MQYEFKTIEMLPQTVLSIRTRTSVVQLPKVLDRIYTTIFQHINEMGEQPAGPPFVAYYNMDMQDLDIEAGYPVTKALPVKGDIQVSALPAGEAASGMHTGPYDQLPPTYNAMLAWMQEQGLEAAGTVYEFYLNDPSQTMPEDLKTQILYPLKS
jgi:effector-binding domain-containing protein